MSIEFNGNYGWTDMSPAKFAKVMQKATARIKALHKELKFDAIAFTGSSGAACAFVMLCSTGIPIMYVRKDGENSHGSELECSGRATVKSYLIVDDFIGQGDTVNSIYSKIIRRARSYSRTGTPMPECKGIYLYDASNKKLRQTLHDSETGEQSKVRVYR